MFSEGTVMVIKLSIGWVHFLKTMLSLFKPYNETGNGWFRLFFIVISKESSRFTTLFILKSIVLLVFK